MSSLLNFFAFVFKGLLKALSLVLSAPGLLLTSIATLVTSVGVVLNEITSSTSSLANVVPNDLGSSEISTIQSVFNDFPTIMQWIAYMLSFDTFLNGVLTVIIVLVPLVLTLATFLFITLPLFLVEFYLLKFTIWIATAVLPSQYVPGVISAVGSNHHITYDDDVVIDV